MKETLSEEELTPFGGENLPFKEIKEESVPKTIKITNNKFLLMVFGGIIFVLVLVIALLLINQIRFRFQPPASPVPAPVMFSPSPAATSGANNSIGERLDLLEKKLKEVDLQQTEYAFPLLDFSFSFGQKR